MRRWDGAADDAHLQNITDFVFGAFGRSSIRSMWLAGHSQGGFTSNRIVCSDYFKGKVDGWLSLSGGRIGQAPFVRQFGPPKADGTRVEGGVTLFQPSGEQMPIYDAAMKYMAAGTPTVIFAGEEYGTGSSRDWAAKGTKLLGVRAVIVESFERIHRSNLAGMGVLPLQFAAGEDASTERVGTAMAILFISRPIALMPMSTAYCV